MDVRPISMVLAFLLGACATAAVESFAAPEPGPAPAPGPTAAELSATVVALADAPTRVSPTGSATVRHLARGQNAYVGKLEIEPGAAIPEHQDATEEYIHVLSGSGSMTIEGKTHAIAAGTTIFMPVKARVSFENGDQAMVAIQVFAGPEPAAKYDAWVEPDGVQRPEARR